MPGVDPMFTDDDAVELLDYIEWKQALCSGCGEPRGRSFAPENEYAYTATTFICHSCSARSHESERSASLKGAYVIAEFTG